MENSIDSSIGNESSPSVSDSISANTYEDQHSDSFSDAFSSGKDSHFSSFKDMLGDDQHRAFNGVTTAFSTSLDASQTLNGNPIADYANQAAASEALGATGIQDGLGALVTNQIDQLNSAGDTAVFQLRAEATAAVVLGGKGQYGYRVQVTQEGGAPPAGMVGETTVPEYQVTFDKRLLGGINGELPVPGIDPKAELNLRSADGVTLTFDTKEEAARAVALLGQLAASETLKDTSSLISPATSSPGDIASAPQNPLTEANDELSSSTSTHPAPSAGSGSTGTVLEVGGDAIAPDADEMAFLTDHITGYTTHLDAQARIKLGADLPLGLFELEGELRGDAVSGITRTVELPRDGEPGSVTYTFAMEDQLRSKEGAAVGLEIPDVLEADAGLRARLDHAAISREVSFTWEYAEDEMGPMVSGQPYPEIASAADGSIRPPDRMTVSLETGRQDQPLWDVTRTDMVNDSLTLSIDQPGQTSAAAINAMLCGDVSQALDVIGDNAQLTLATQQTQRSGFDLQPELSLEVLDVGQIKASLIVEAGVDDVTQRNEWVLGDNPATRDGSVDSTQSAQDAAEDQVVVVPREGLTLRDGANGERSSVFYHGTFLDPTGQSQMDENGRNWIEVTGLDVNDNTVTGWVDAQYVTDHPAGDMNDEGRINPELDSQGYRAHRVETGDNIWDIAQAQGFDFQETVALNAGHLIDPALIFEGDVVYLPVIDTPPGDTTRPVEISLAPDSVSESAADPVADSDGPSGTSSSAAQPDYTRDPADSLSDATGSHPTGPGDSVDPSTSSSGVTGSSDPAPPTTEPTAPATPTTEPQRRPTAEILTEYQVVEEEMVEWHPKAGPFTFIELPFYAQTLTETEASLLDRLGQREGMLGLYDFKGLRDQAYDTADQFFPREDAQGNRVRGAEDGHNDAFRHACWNAMMTSRFGEDFAVSFGTAHEARPGNQASREAMDLFNNALGRRIATENPDASEAELAELIFDAIENGEAMVIDGSGNLAYSDQVGVGQTGSGNGVPPIDGGNAIPEWTTSN